MPTAHCPLPTAHCPLPTAHHDTLYALPLMMIAKPTTGDYADVGWVINAEATRCMNCAETFGIYCYAHHCKSCGNVVCDKCSRSTAHIYELQDLGPLRVCDMCYWGQVSEDDWLMIYIC